MEKMYQGIDAGGSLTKDFTIIGDNETFQERNNYVLKYDGYINTKDYINDDSEFTEKLDLTIKIDNAPKGDYKLQVVKLTDEINSNRWLLGNIANAVSVNVTKISNSVKMKQVHYYLNIINSIICSMQEKGVSEADINLGVLLPAKQYFNLEKEMIVELLSGNINVKNNLTGDVFDIIIRRENIIIKPEAVVAFSSCFVGKDGKLTEIGKTFAPKFNVVIDIGENTTDIAGIKGGSPDPLTFHSFDYAGALLMQYVEREISRKLDGYTPPMDELKKTYGTGFIELGANKEWVGEEISLANREFAGKLYNDFTQYYLLGKGFKMPQIAAFMFIGGGSTKIEKITSVNEHFLNMVKEESRFTSTFSPPGDLRKANINGLADLLRVTKNKANKSA